MNTIFLQPTDVLFFRDGRPMTGSLAGHGAAWPMPNVINHAFHAALHRAKLDEVGSGKLHVHRRGMSGVYAENAQRDRKFGSLITAGPFPVKDGTTWFFPRPQDLQDGALQPALLPADLRDGTQSSLPVPLEYPVANRLAPDKESSRKAWLTKAAFENYLTPSGAAMTPDEVAIHTVADSEIFSSEQNIGIGVDPETGTTGRGDAEGQIYSAHYLRLNEAWQLGVCATAEDKEYNHPVHGRDLVKALLNGGQNQIMVGGQQRICSARAVSDPVPPLPRGMIKGFESRGGKFLVKWVLLSPAVWPAIQAENNSEIQINAHPGGWLPNWIGPQNGEVLLKSGNTDREPGEGRDSWRQRVRRQNPIAAKLVAAIIPKPLVVSGWALPDEAGGEPGGAQSAHAAVAAGAVYYFAADTAAEADKLAAALNWHGGDLNPATIKNRRSALLGEKGFGLGVCGTWQFFQDVDGRSRK